MRILHVVGGLDRGGAETWLVQVLRHVDRSRCTMDFLVFGDLPSAYEDEVKALGARVLRCAHPSNPLRFAWQFRRILSGHGPYDCVHTHIHHASGYVLLLAAMLRVSQRIAHSHLDTRDLDRHCPFVRKAYVEAMKMLVRHLATAGFAVSESAAQSLFSGSWKADSRWSLCPLGIDLRPFHEEVDAEAARAQLGIASSGYIVGHAGRFCEQKNHRFLVEIAERFLRLQPNATFLLVGDGPLRPAIEDMVRSRGLAARFVFAGRRPDVPRLMLGAMDCFLFPSLYEGLGLVLWEAQAAGLDCLISANIPEEADAIPALITRLRLDEPVARWAEVLSAMAKNRPARTGVRATSTLRLQGFSVEASAQRLLQLYDAGGR